MLRSSQKVKKTKFEGRLVAGKPITHGDTNNGTFAWQRHRAHGLRSVSQHGVTSNQSKTRDAGSGALRGILKNAEQSCLECNNTRKQPFQQSEDAPFCIKEARDRLRLCSHGLQMEIMSRSDIC